MSQAGPHESGMQHLVPAPHTGASLPASLPDPDEGGVDYRRLLGTVLRHKWWILVLTILVTAASVMYVRSRPDEYMAQATVWIDASRRGSEGPIRTRELLSASAWLELLRSYVVLDEVVMRERLFVSYGDPNLDPVFSGFNLAPDFRAGSYRLEIDRSGSGFRLLAADGGLVESGVIGDSIGRTVGFLWQPSAAELAGRTRIDFVANVPREAAIRLSHDLGARIDRTGNFMRLDLRGRSPQRTASVLNAVVDRFVEVASDLKGSHLVEQVESLEDQLTYSRENLEAAERALETFRVSTITLPSEEAAAVAAGLEVTRNPVLANFFRLRVEQEQVRRDRAAILAALNDGGTRIEALEIIPSVRNSTQLMTVLNELAGSRAEMRALLHRYTAEHMSVQEVAQRVERLESRIVPGLARELTNELAARDRSIQDQIGDAAREMEQIPPRAIEEARLRRQVAVSEDLYRTVQRRYEETRLASSAAVPDVRVLDRARAPRNPVNTESSRLVLLAFLGSLGLGVAGAILRDRLDPTLRYAEQVTDDLGLVVLGAVPDLGRRKRQRREKQLEATEAFRSIRMNVMHAYGSAGPVTLAVSSPGPGDGKTFVSTNLALSFADMGKRVLLIDGDIRRGSLNKAFDTARSPGLTDFLGGSAGREEIIRSTSFQGVALMPTGRVSHAGPELISSSQMRMLLADLRSDYDVIIIDTAPLGAGVDPFVFATLTGNLVLVMRTGTTNRGLAGAKLELMARLPIRLLGSVINGLDARSHSYYHRYYSYLPGYESVDADEDAPAGKYEVTT